LLLVLELFSVQVEPPFVVRSTLPLCTAAKHTVVDGHEMPKIVLPPAPEF
jgi:hypothetical protein